MISPGDRGDRFLLLAQRARLKGVQETRHAVPGQGMAPALADLVEQILGGIARLFGRWGAAPGPSRPRGRSDNTRADHHQHRTSERTEQRHDGEAGKHRRRGPSAQQPEQRPEGQGQAKMQGHDGDHQQIAVQPGLQQQDVPQGRQPRQQRGPVLQAARRGNGKVTHEDGPVPRTTGARRSRVPASGAGCPRARGQGRSDRG